MRLPGNYLFIYVIIIFVMNNKNEKESKFSDMPESFYFSKDIDGQINERVERIKEEFLDGFYAVRKYPKSVTFFGSARFNEDNIYYQKARILAQKLCKEGFAVITGGGPGIMEAGNRGSKEACNLGIGFNIELPKEQSLNPYITDKLSFHYFFSRKVSMVFSGEAFLFFPGGFGTLDEFFEVLTLVQTKKLPRLPLILVGRAYWEPLHDFITENLLNKFQTISPEDLNLYRIEDDIDEIVKLVKAAPMRYEYE